MSFAGRGVLDVLVDGKTIFSYGAQGKDARRSGEDRRARFDAGDVVLAFPIKRLATTRFGHGTETP
jgi:hypothetical protein